MSDEIRDLAFQIAEETDHLVTKSGVASVIEQHLRAALADARREAQEQEREGCAQLADLMTLSNPAGIAAAIRARALATQRTTG